MIRKHIQEGNLSGAQKKLLEFFELIKEIENDFTIISGSIENLVRDKNLNIVPSGETIIKENKLRRSSLYTCQAIEKELLAYFPTLNYQNESRPLKVQLEGKLLKYKEIEQSFEGQTTTFFRAKELDSERLVMLRVFREHSYKAQEPVLIEDKKLKKIIRIKHRNIIKVLNTNLNDYPKYLVLEYIHGVSLDHLIERIPFSLKRAIDLFRKLCDAVYYLHINGIVHSNIKPDKVLIDNELMPVISPFDIASSVKNNPSLNINELLYSAPELFQDVNKTPDFKSDQFSLGLLAYELFTGISLFEWVPEKGGEEKVKFNALKIFENRVNFSKKSRRKALFARLPMQVRKIITKMLAVEPEARYDSLRDVKLALNNIKIESSEEVDIAMASYERCCIANHDFIQEFYEELFDRSEYHKEIQEIFGLEKIQKEKNNIKRSLDIKRHKMLRVAVDLLIDGQKEAKNLKRVIELDVHKQVHLHHHLSFLKTLIKCVEKNDPLWSDSEDDDEHMSVKEAWEKVEKSVDALLSAE